MTFDELHSDLTARLGDRVEEFFTRDGAPVDDITELYQPFLAGFGGQLRLKRGQRLAWKLWLEEGRSLEFLRSRFAQLSRSTTAFAVASDSGDWRAGISAFYWPCV